MMHKMTNKKTKNKDFMKWTRAEPVLRKDNIISTDWHERLERIPMFKPSYSKCRPDMGYILSMEYGRIWQKEKDEWYSLIFKPQFKQADLNKRRKKLRKEFLESKRQAEIKIRERKERLAREAEEKAKAEAEAQEKAKRIKAKLEKCTMKKRPKKTKKEEKAKEVKKQEPEPEKCETVANGAQEVAKDDSSQQPGKVEQKPEEPKKLEETPCDIMCMPYQVKAAVERMQQKEAAAECAPCANRDTPSEIIPDDIKPC
ncbi:UNVERIFIED_CONTAM: hypothetical protein PYX00_006457 [Menopon gallinae]|uniref:Uncharacterized protein n=1 Tax=Menopon gallinae TaxID=328185 RepID=A0AAW2HWH4_9NEOP